MSFDAKAIQVMIASPGDVQEERQAATDEVNDWNNVNAASRGIVLLPVRWETHTTPQFGAHPQVFVNKQILEGADILIGIFGLRLGTPTTAYPSGTVEEISIHAARQKTVKLYFSEAPLPRDYDRDQYAALESYRTECQTQGLYWPFTDVTGFRKDFRRHLELELNNSRYTPNVVSPRITISSPVVSQPVLSKHAGEMLKEAVAAGGDIMVADRIGLSSIWAGSKQFGKDDTSPRTVAIWKAALAELQSRGFVEHISGAIRRVTESGYKFADTLEQDSKPEQMTASSHLSNEAQDLLVAASTDPHGDVLESETTDGYDLLTNRQSFVPDRNARTVSQWRAALVELQENGLLSNKQGDIYKITKKGFEVAETLLPDPLG
jgi:hypothetical protein